MKITFEKGELKEKLAGLIIASGLKGKKLNYATSKNRDKLKKLVKRIDAQEKETPEYEAYNDARIALCLEHAKKTNGGSPVIVQDGDQKRYDMVDKGAFDKALEELREKHKPSIDEQNKLEKEYEEMLKEEIEIEVHMISLDIVPEDINGAQMDGIFWMIKEE